MSETTRTRQSAFKQLILKEGEYVYKIETKTQEFDTVLREWKTTKVETTFETLAQNGLVKELEFSALIVRSAITEPNLTPRKGFFVQKFRAHIPNERSFRNFYLSLFNETVNVGIDNKTRKITRVVLHTLPNTTQILTVGASSGDKYADFITPLGTPKRVSEANAKKIYNEPNCIGIFGEDSSGKAVFALV